MLDYNFPLPVIRGLRPLAPLLKQDKPTHPRQSRPKWTPSDHATGPLGIYA
jgi:hypothetical protein